MKQEMNGWQWNQLDHMQIICTLLQTDNHTDQPLLTHIIRMTRLKFFGHIAHTNPSMDHCRALQVIVSPLPRDWNCRSGRPCHTWLQTIESDLTPLNIGRATAYH